MMKASGKFAYLEISSHCIRTSLCKPTKVLTLVLYFLCPLAGFPIASRTRMKYECYSKGKGKIIIVIIAINNNNNGVG